MTFVLTDEAAPGVRMLTPNRPERRNAVSAQMFDELIAAFRSVDGDEEVRAVVLTGAGTAFCAGVDLRDVGDPALLEKRRLAEISPTAALLQVQTPVIAAANGACVAGGLELVLACDIVIAAEEATFAAERTALERRVLLGSPLDVSRVLGGRRRHHTGSTDPEHS